MNTIKYILPLLLIIGCNGIPGNPKAETCVSEAFTIEQQEKIISAADEWHDRTNGDVDLHLHIGSFSGCELEILPEANLSHNGERALGMTANNGKWIKLDTIDNFIEGIEVQTAFSLHMTALHELGHYLTGIDHSDSKSDVMFKSQTPLYYIDDNGQKIPRPDHVEYLSENDIKRFYDNQ